MGMLTLEGLALMILEFNGFVEAREWHNGLLQVVQAEYLKPFKIIEESQD
jgi:hypothetical protein